MLFFPNAKINVGLNIISKRTDGFHNIETIFCPVELSDILEFVPLAGIPSGHAGFSVSGTDVDCEPEKNLCVKAYQLLNKDFTLPAIDIHLHKIIPPGAGLGGGSSDAAFMLKNLNAYFELGLGDDELCRYASILGSDGAFFIRNKTMLGYERGNVFSDIMYFPEDFNIIIVNPGIHVSTAEAYAGVSPRKPEKPLSELIQLPPEEWKMNIKNDFEESIFKKHPEIGQLKQVLYNTGAEYASMSGSGSSVYGLFRELPDLKGRFEGYFVWAGRVVY
jgi:4-diphosphocytidyl-2-C-methyl-D-erythritol kinase